MKRMDYWDVFESHVSVLDAMDAMEENGARMIVASRLRETMEEVKDVLRAHPGAKLTARMFYVELLWEAMKLAKEFNVEHIRDLAELPECQGQTRQLDVPAIHQDDLACDQEFHNIHVKQLRKDVAMQRVRWLEMDVRNMSDKEFQDKWAMMQAQILRLTEA